MIAAWLAFQTLIATSGGPAADRLFAGLAPADAEVVYIPTAASSLRSDKGTIWTPGEEKNREAYLSDLRERFGRRRVTILHTRDRREADGQAFTEPLRRVNAVWISGGNAGRLADAYLGTRVVKELEALLARGGVVAGESAGAIILGWYVVRGNPDKPVLMVKGRERGFGLLPGVAINPHLSAAKRENELVSVVDRYPKMLGIGIDDDAGIVVQGGVAEVFGSGRVAIYDNVKRDGVWYYWLKTGEKLDLRARVAVRQ